jgi:hypothetical protein
MRKRTRYSLLLALALVLALVVAVWLRRLAPPEVARLLPESDAIVYVNLKPLRAVTRLDKEPVSRSPEYQRFVDATGIVPERDLDAAAFALHRMDNPNGPNGPVAYSEVFEGRFDGERLAHYLAHLATSQETYAGRSIYTVPVEGRTLRIAQLGYDTIAASNMPTPEQIHAILDRYRASASPFSGSSLLEARYRDVPLLSVAWGIGHVGLPFSERGRIQIFGLALPLPEDTTFVVSIRPSVNHLHLRVEEIAPTEADAARSAQVLSSIISLLHAVPPKLADEADKTDADALRELIDSLSVERKKDRVVLTANSSFELIRRLASPSASPSGASGVLPFTPPVPDR